MVMAITVWNLGFHLSASTDSSLKALKKPIFCVHFLKPSSGFVATKQSYILHKTRLLFSGTTIIPRAAAPVTDVQRGNQGETDTVPTPIVIIDQDSDPNTTVVEITFGDRLGALLDTMSALKSLGLKVVKANVFLDSSNKHNKFSITKALLAKAKFHVS